MPKNQLQELWNANLGSRLDQAQLEKFRRVVWKKVRKQVIEVFLKDGIRLGVARGTMPWLHFESYRFAVNTAIEECTEGQALCSWQEFDHNLRIWLDCAYQSSKAILELQPDQELPLEIKDPKRWVKKRKEESA